MNLKRFFSPSPPLPAQGPLVRIDGSLSGNAFVQGGTLERLQAAVQALSGARPYTYDLELAAGRFSLIIVEPILPRDRFSPDPETCLAEDLGTILEIFPPEERTKVDCTFRALWQEGGEVMGVVMTVEPPGRIRSHKRARPQEEYDRLAEKQDLEGYRAPPAPRLPQWATWLLALIVIAGSYFLYQYYGPGSTLRLMETALLEAELKGLEHFIYIEDPLMREGRITLTLHPREGYAQLLETALKEPASPDTGPPAALEGTANPDTDEPAAPEGTAQPAALEGQRRKLLAQALLAGRLEIEIFDEDGVLIDLVPLDLGAFDGTAAVKLETRPLRLDSPPARVSFAP